MASRPFGWRLFSALPAHAFARARDEQQHRADEERHRRDAGSDFVALRRPADRRRADGQHQRRGAEQHADGAPDQLQNPEQVEMRGQDGSSLQPSGPSTKLSDEPVRLSRSHAPEDSANRDADFDDRGWCARWREAEAERIPVPDAGGHPHVDGMGGGNLADPAQVAHHSFHTSPRPPQRGQVRRSGTSNGTVTPQNASRGVNTISADSVIAGSAVKNASRMRSSTLDTEGKSIATSSENQVAPLGALAGQRAVVLTAARRIAQDVVGAQSAP